ncbi:MAG: competence/damage-inducible protein A [Halobacteriaceae archaeon]
MRVAVVTVGDELLAGEVTDTNSAWLASRLTDRGATVARMVTLPDDVDVIADAIADLADRFDAVVVTGGVGPTHDDRTLSGVAAAFDREITEHPDAVDWFDQHSDYQREDLTTGTTHLPAGARMIGNDVGVAPGAVVENVYVLPGVPAEMESMFERVADEFGGDRFHVETIEAAEPESALLDRIDAVRERFDVSVGSYPGDPVRIRLRSTDPEAVETAADWLRGRVESTD